MLCGDDVRAQHHLEEIGAKKNFGGPTSELADMLHAEADQKGPTVKASRHYSFKLNFDTTH